MSGQPGSTGACAGATGAGGPRPAPLRRSGQREARPAVHDLAIDRLEARSGERLGDLVALVREYAPDDEKAAVKKLTVGAGDKANPKAGAAGMLYLDDIGFGHPAQ